jgi:hypothetical protein
MTQEDGSLLKDAVGHALVFVLWLICWVSSDHPTLVGGPKRPDKEKGPTVVHRKP